MFGFLRAFIKATRLGAWASSFAGFFILLSAYFFTLHYFDVRLFSYLLVYQFTAYSFAFLINSRADRKADAHARKKNAGLGKKGALLSVSLGLLTIFLPLMLGLEFLAFGAAGFLLAYSYSFRPIRLKEKGIFGILAAGFGTAFLPFLLTGHYAGIFCVETAYFAFGFFFATVTFEMLHQIADFKSDREWGCKTWAVRQGKEKAIMKLKALAVFTMLFYLSALAVFPFPQSASVFLAFIALFSRSFIFAMRLR